MLSVKVLRIAQMVARLGDEVWKLEQDVKEAHGLGKDMLRIFEEWESEGGTMKKTSAEKDGLAAGNENGKQKELVDLREWPLPPKRTSWVMVQGERKRKRRAKSCRR